jgi:hypothetical protein
MFSLQNTDSVIILVLSFFAFVFSITLSGTLQAILARRFGDNTAEELGFAEFNPFVYIGTFDFIWFLLFDIMIGRPVPLRLLDGIDRSQGWFRARAFVLYAIRPLCNIILAIIASLIHFLFCKALFAALLDGGTLAKNSMQLSSLSYLLCLFCARMVRNNIFLATFESCRQAINFFVVYKLEKDFRFIEYADYLLVLGPLLLWIFFSPIIIQSFVYIIDCVVFGITQACGVA